MITEIDRFVKIGKQQLEPYLSEISHFIKEKRQSPQEINSLQSKPPETYLRNMLAVGILNRIQREAFVKTDQRLIVAPDCLKNYSDWACCKADLGNASECTQCNSDCIVFEIMETFDDSKTTIVFEPEELFAYLQEMKKKRGTVGVVGIACVLTLLSGFAHTLKLKLPTQGVFLNYSSCAHHWANPAYNTNYSFSQLLRIMSQEARTGSHSSQQNGETYSLERPPLSPDKFYKTLDALSLMFVEEYLPQFERNFPKADLFTISREILKALVPDLITRDAA